MRDLPRFGPDGRLAIYERQQSAFDTRVCSEYEYAGIDKVSGLHRFRADSGDVDLFAKRKDAPSGWHLIRGSWCYEFVRGA